jgi:negative regulator of sigma-B (phosphoserine phosphatase)
LEFGVASRNKKYENACGDSYMILESDGYSLVAVVDGLGHGAEAAKASKMAVELIKKNSDMELTAILRKCHDALKGSRGAVIGLARFDTARARIEFAGVGNIEFRALDPTIKPISMNGIVGYNMRRISKFEYPLAKGAVVALFSDGISSRLEFERYARSDLQSMADSIMRDHGKETDDATIVVARYGVDA